MVKKNTVLKELKENGWQAYYSHKGHSYYRLKDNFEGPEIAICDNCEDGCECLIDALSLIEKYNNN